MVLKEEEEEASIKKVRQQNKAGIVKKERNLVFLKEIYITFCLETILFFLSVFLI